MPVAQISNLTGLNLYMNPLNLNNGEMVQCVNMDSMPFGAKRKRRGYSTYLGTADGSAVTSLFQFRANNGTTFFNYRASGSSLYYSLQGTGDWTLAGNGTIGAGAHVGAAVMNNTLIVGDGVGSTRHTTSGTSFTNTTLAPIGEFFDNFQNRIYIGGTASTLFFSSANDPVNWSTSGTSDSSSLTVPGPGKMGRIFHIGDRLTLTKNTGGMYVYDGFSLVDPSWSMGPSSPYSVDASDGFYFWVNQLGMYGAGGARPQLLSNAVQPFFYNYTGSAVAGTQLRTAPGVVNKYNYYVALGDTTDDVIKETITNSVAKYDYQKNELSFYSFGTLPTAFMQGLGGIPTVDNNNEVSLIFGDSSGQCYAFGGTATSDNGVPIQAKMQFMFNDGLPHEEKEFRWLYLYFNPGNQAQARVAITDNFDQARKRWLPIGDCSSGLKAFRFPPGSRGNFLFIEITESSTDADFIFYGYSVDAEVVPSK